MPQQSSGHGGHGPAPLRSADPLAPQNQSSIPLPRAALPLPLYSSVAQLSSRSHAKRNPDHGSPIRDRLDTHSHHQQQRRPSYPSSSHGKTRGTHDATM